MKHFYAIFLFFSLLTLHHRVGWAQNLETIGWKKGIKTSGSVNLNAVGYLMHGMAARRDPLDWFVSGNLNLNLFGYSAPLSFSYSNTQRSYSQPFNQLSFTPQYKWVKAYIGYTSMSFSPYTLSGHVFLGGGVELSPGKWRIAAMYGRLKKPVPFNPADSLGNVDATFRRMGYGLKVGYEDASYTLGVSLFSAKDEVSSLPYVLPNSTLTPKENLAASVNGRKQWGRFFIEGEYAFSSLNNDTRSQREDSAATTGSNLLKGMMPQTATSRYYDAFNGGIGYQGTWYGLQIKYERIAPEYQTLGAYYFNNDLRNITLAPSIRLFKNTLNFMGNVGVQRNNLDNTRASTTRRFVGSLSATYAPSEHWSLAGSYSNFSTYTNMRPPTDPFFRNNLDSLNFYQVSNTTNGTVSYNFGSQEHRQSIMLNGSFQRANDQASYEGGSNVSDFYTSNASYSYAIAPIHTTLATSFNYYTSRSLLINTVFWGPTLSVARSFLEKMLRASVASSYNQSSANGIQSSDIWNTRLSSNYSPKSKNEKAKGQHTFSLGLNVLRRFKNTSQGPSFTEWTATGGYTFSF